MKNTAILCCSLALAPSFVFAAPASRAAKPASLLALAGYQALEGEGVVITLSDREASQPKQSQNRIPGLVHDYDLLAITNELRAAGAQGISISGVRLTNQSAIRAVGPNIQVGGQAIRAPFQIQAVGKAELLRARLQTSYGVLEQMKKGGPRVQLKVVPALRLNAAPIPASWKTNVKR